MAKLLYKDKHQVLHSGLTQYFNESLFSDIVIVAADGRRLQCHQLVLAAASPCLRRILETGSLRPTAELPVFGVDSSALEAVIQFFYTGTCHFALASCVALCTAAQRLEVTSLAEACVEYVASALQRRTVLTVLTQAQESGNVPLLRLALTALEQWFDDVHASEAFAALPFAALVAVLQHCRATQTTDNLFGAAWAWVLSDLSHMTNLQDLADVVTLPSHLTLEQLVNMGLQQRTAYNRLLTPGSQSRQHFEALVVKIWPALASRSASFPLWETSSQRPAITQDRDDRGAVTAGRPASSHNGTEDSEEQQQRALLERALPRDILRLFAAEQGAQSGGRGSAGDGDGGSLHLDLDALALFAQGVLSGLTVKEALAASRPTKAPPLAPAPRHPRPSEGASEEQMSGPMADVLRSLAVCNDTMPGPLSRDGQQQQQHLLRGLTSNLSCSSSMNSGRSGPFNSRGGLNTQADVDAARWPAQPLVTDLQAARGVQRGSSGKQHDLSKRISLEARQHQQQQDDERAYFEEQLQHVLQDNDNWDIEVGREGISMMGALPPLVARGVDLGRHPLDHLHKHMPSLAPHQGAAPGRGSAGTLLPPASLPVASGQQLGGTISRVDNAVGARGWLPGEPLPAGGLGHEVRGAVQQHSAGRTGCQIEGCLADLSASGDYHVQHRICYDHYKVSCVSKDGACQRFCHQCAVFHPISEFDGCKRSCQSRGQPGGHRRRSTNTRQVGRPHASVEAKAHSSGGAAGTEEFDSSCRSEAPGTPRAEAPAPIKDISSRSLIGVSSKAGASPASHGVAGAVARPDERVSGLDMLAEAVMLAEPLASQEEAGLGLQPSEQAARPGHAVVKEERWSLDGQGDGRSEKKRPFDAMSV